MVNEMQVNSGGGGSSGTLSSPQKVSISAYSSYYVNVPSDNIITWITGNATYTAYSRIVNGVTVEDVSSMYTKYNNGQLEIYNGSGAAREYCYCYIE